MMAPMKITVVDTSGKERKIGVEEQADVDKWLSKFNVESFIDSEGCEFINFKSLIDGGTYTLGPPRKDQQEVALSPDLISGLKALVDDHLSSKRSIVLSQVSTATGNALLSKLSLPIVGASWPNKPNMNELAQFPKFQWFSGDKDCAENRRAYMAHLRANITWPNGYSPTDVQPKRDLLNVDIGIPWDDSERRIRGTTDVVIAELEDIANDAIRNSIASLIELKKPQNLLKKDHQPQTICEHIAASALNYSAGIVSVLTDLNDGWTFYWLARRPQAPSGVAIFKLVLQQFHNPAGLARYLLESFKDESRSATLPQTFLDRISLEDAFEIMIERRDSKKRARLNDSDRDPSGSNLGHSHDTSPPKTPSGGRQGPGDNGGTGNRQTGGNAVPGGASHALDLAGGLRLLAGSNFDGDVANDLDLLDMVDEDSQYQIVRSFAAKYIVPHITGHSCPP